MFCKLLSIKEPQTLLQNKQTTVYTKLSKNVESKHQKESWDELCTFQRQRGRREWVILAFWIAYIILLSFCNEPAKNFVVYIHFQLNLPSPPIRASMFLTGPPLPFQVYVLYGYVPHGTTVWDHVWQTIFGHYALKGKTWNSECSSSSFGRL